MAFRWAAGKAFNKMEHHKVKLLLHKRKTFVLFTSIRSFFITSLCRTALSVDCAGNLCFGVFTKQKDPVSRQDYLFSGVFSANAAGTIVFSNTANSKGCKCLPVTPSSIKGLLSPVSAYPCLLYQLINSVRTVITVM